MSAYDSNTAVYEGLDWRPDRYMEGVEQAWVWSTRTDDDGPYEVAIHRVGGSRGVVVAEDDLLAAGWDWDTDGDSRRSNPAKFHTAVLTAAQRKWGRRI